MSVLKIKNNQGQWKHIPTIKGENGERGPSGPRGYSAYEIAVQHGFKGTEQDWLYNIGMSNNNAGGLTQSVKTALLNAFAHLVYIDENSSIYYNDLVKAFEGGSVTISSIMLNQYSLLLNPGETFQLVATTDPNNLPVTWSSLSPHIASVDSNGLVTGINNGEALIIASCGGLTVSCNITVSGINIVSITASYIQPGVIYENEPLMNLKQNLLVTAIWSDDTATIISNENYNLSGTLTQGISIVTVHYGNKATTFSVNVTRKYIYNWDFTKSLVDTVNGNTAVLLNDLERSNEGLVYNNASQSVQLPNVYARGRIIEIDVTDFDIQDQEDHNVRFVMINSTDGLLIRRWKETEGWSGYYNYEWSDSIYGDLVDTERQIFANSTIKIEISNEGISSLYVNGTFIGSLSLNFPDEIGNIWLGSTMIESVGGNLYNVKITGVRVFGDSYPVAIKAYYTPVGNVNIHSQLDNLKNDLIVTATMSDGTIKTINNYQLSGSLAIGENNITVNFDNLSDTFRVIGVDGPLYEWDFTKSSTDLVGGNRVEYLNGLTRTSQGLNYTADAQAVRLPNAYERGRAIEIDVSDFDIQVTENSNTRFVMTSASSNGMLIYRWQETIGWSAYRNKWSSHIYGNLTERNAFANSTIRMEISNDGFVTLYKDGIQIGTTDVEFPDDIRDIWIGNQLAATNSNAGIYNAKITGVRIYDKEVS